MGGVPGHDFCNPSPGENLTAGTSHSTERRYKILTMLLVSMLGGGEEPRCIRCHLRVDAVNLVSKTPIKSPFLPHYLLSLSYTFAETTLACCEGGVNTARSVCVRKRLHELCMSSLKGYRAHIFTVLSLSRPCRYENGESRSVTSSHTGGLECKRKGGQ